MTPWTSAIFSSAFSFRVKGNLKSIFRLLIEFFNDYHLKISNLEDNHDLLQMLLLRHCKINNTCIIMGPKSSQHKRSDIKQYANKINDKESKFLY